MVVRPTHLHQSSDDLRSLLPRQQSDHATTVDHGSVDFGQNVNVVLPRTSQTRDWLRRNWKLPFLFLIASMVLSVLLRQTRLDHIDKLLHFDTGVPHCPAQKPNLILSSNDGRMNPLDTFKYMHSLDLAIGISMVHARNRNECPPAPIEVKIMVPYPFASDPSPSIKLLLKRHPYLKFVENLDDFYPQWPKVLTRFIAWRNYTEAYGHKYSKLILSDLDIIYQRDPFTMPLEDKSMIVYAEWHGMPIIDDPWNLAWITQCTQNGFLQREDVAGYLDKPILCDGNTYGTMDAMQAYLDVMASGMINAQGQCNDQGYGFHIVYSGMLERALTKVGASLKVQQSPNSLFGVVGTAPYVRFNEWGEIMNDEGSVMTAVHQFKHHRRLTDLVNEKFGWQGPFGDDPLPGPTYAIDEAYNLAHPDEFMHDVVTNVQPGACSGDSLCSCKFEDCQSHQSLRDFNGRESMRADWKALMPNS